jgi:hypothetical protein
VLRAWASPSDLLTWACRRTHVVLPASVVPRRAYTAEVIGAALLAEAGGAPPQGGVRSHGPALAARGTPGCGRSGRPGMPGRGRRRHRHTRPGQLPTQANGDLCVALVEALDAAARLFTPTSLIRCTRRRGR